MNNRKYSFSPPYNRDSRLVIRPLFTTTHEITYPYHNRGRYNRIKSRYKQQPPFIKPHNTNVQICKNDMSSLSTM
jgi:hypothetical protein